MLTTAHQQQQWGRHARDVPCGGGGVGNVGGGAGEHDGNVEEAAMAAEKEADNGLEIAPQNLKLGFLSPRVKQALS